MNNFLKSKLLSCFALAVALFALPIAVQAQVTIANSTGANGTYTTLKAAFDALNAQGTQVGNNITISITGNTTETASAVLQPTTSSWTSLTISPSGGAARTISGAIAAGSPLIDLNGADNVTIDGLNSGSNSLTITNTTVSATAGTSTIRFRNDATSNTITNCNINGATTATDMGVIVFGTGTVTGNDNNNINNCDIADASGTFPLNSIVSTGTSAAIDNSNNTLNANNISNYFSAGSLSSGILLTNVGNSTWTITNNKLFQTATRNYTTANPHNGISVQTGDGYVITGNTIGYATSTSTGIYTMTGTIATRFIGINLAVGTTTATSVQNNTITAISLATSSGATTLNGILCGINVTAGNVNIGTVTGNTIGGSTGTGLLSAVPTTTQGTVVGINTSSTGNVDIRNNIIGGLSSTSGTATVAGGITGIRCSATGTVAGLTISNNTVGNTTANNMVAGINGTTTGSSIVSGIHTVNNITVTPTISNNTIQNLASFGTNTSGFVRGVMTSTTGINGTYLITGNTISNLTTNSALVNNLSGQCAAQGIMCSTGTNNIVSQNTISNISAINTGTTSVNVVGIACSNANNTTVTRNRIYNITNAGTSTTVTAPAVAVGIAYLTGLTAVTITNNMISLGNAQTTNTSFIGIWDSYSANNINTNVYFNSVNIEGTAASGAQPSFGFYRGNFSVTATTATVDVRNNIFTNTRNGGTGKHYAISNNYGATASTTGWGSNASNYNVLFGNAATIGNWGGVADQTFAAWQAASAGDGNSLSANPLYVNTSTPDLHIQGTSPAKGVGIGVSGVADDYDGQARYNAPDADMGADAISTFTGVNVVTVAGSTGANGNYGNLFAAFTAINANGTQAGNNITVSITGNSTELGTATLNQPSVSSWTSLTISPSGGAARTISANLAGVPLIDLNGVDNVTIDGLNAGGNSLTIVNQSTSNSAGTSTIRFQNDASNNTITNCTVNGASTMAATTNGGTIWFSTTTGANGNDNNTISNCNIGSDGTNLPTKAIYSSGTSTSIAHYNSNNTITGCNIYDFFSATVASNGFYLATSTTDWTISNNKLYQTATRTQTTGAIHAGIEIASSIGNNNHLISGNTIGYANNSGTGTYTFVGLANSRFYPIYFSGAGTTSASTIQNNVISNVAVSGAVAGGGSASPFVSIIIVSGQTNITSNTIGSTTANSLTFTTSSTTATDVYGIYHSPSQNVTISNNQIGGIITNGTATGILILTGLLAGSGTTNTNTVANNTIGYVAAPLVNNSVAAGSRLFGLYNDIGAGVITNNTIRHLTLAAANTGTGINASLIGLFNNNTSSTLGNNISQNTIHSLSNTNSSAAVVVSGIMYQGSTTGTHFVQKNFIHSLSVGGATATVKGIDILAGATTYANNIITLSPSVACQTYGIFETGAASNNNSLYFNTVYLGGSVNSTSRSAALWSNANTNTRDFRNNLFVNARSNAGTGKNYAAYFNYATAGTLTSNFNNYRATGINGRLGFFNGADDTTLPFIVGQDVNSLTTDPAFLATGTVATDYKPTVALTGVAGTGITVDYANTTRGGTPTIGAYEFIAPATITNFTPTSGGVDQVVTITGTNFTGASAVTIGGVAARSYTVVNATTITAVVGDGFATGLVQVTNGTTATSAALGTPNFTRTSCPNTLAALVVTPSNDANGFAGFDVSWNLGAGTYTAINVFYQPQSGAGSTYYTRKTFAGNATSGRLSTVNGAVAYNIYIQGVCTGNSDRVSTTAISGAGLSCSIIGLPGTPLTVNNTDITFTWNTVPNAYLYQPIYQECDAVGNRVAGGQGSTAYLTPAMTATQSWTVSQLKPNTFYRFSVRVHCLQGNSNLISAYSLYPFIQTGSSGTTCAAPAPTLGTAGEINGYASQVINWAAVPSATNGYGIFFRENSQPDWTTYHLGNVLTYTISGLKQGATYTYFVYGACSNGQAPRSAELTFTAGTATLDCNASTLNASVGVSTNPIGATLSWTTTPNAVQAGKLYGIVYSQVSTPGTTYVVYTDNVSQTLSQTTHQGIVANTNYVYRLQTYCDGRLQWANTSGTFNVPPASSAEKAPQPPTGGVTPQGLQALAGLVDLQVYPNPTDSKLSVKLGLETASKVGIKLTDAAGRVVFEENLASNGLNFHHAIDMKNLASGVYLLMVNVEGKTTVRRVVKQ